MDKVIGFAEKSPFSRRDLRSSLLPLGGVEFRPANQYRGALQAQGDRLLCLDKPPTAHPPRPSFRAPLTTVSVSHSHLPSVLPAHSPSCLSLSVLISGRGFSACRLGGRPERLYLNARVPTTSSRAISSSSSTTFLSLCSRFRFTHASCCCVSWYCCIQLHGALSSLLA